MTPEERERAVRVVAALLPFVRKEQGESSADESANGDEVAGSRHDNEFRTRRLPTLT